MISRHDLYPSITLCNKIAIREKEKIKAKTNSFRIRISIHDCLERTWGRLHGRWMEIGCHSTWRSVCRLTENYFLQHCLNCMRFKIRDDDEGEGGKLWENLVLQQKRRESVRESLLFHAKIISFSHSRLFDSSEEVLLSWRSERDDDHLMIWGDDHDVRRQLIITIWWSFSSTCSGLGDDDVREVEEAVFRCDQLWESEVEIETDFISNMKTWCWWSSSSGNHLLWENLLKIIIRRDDEKEKDFKIQQFFLFIIRMMTQEDDETSSQTECLLPHVSLSPVALFFFLSLEDFAASSSSFMFFILLPYNRQQQTRNGSKIVMIPFHPLRNTHTHTRRFSEDSGFGEAEKSATSSSDLTDLNFWLSHSEFFKPWANCASDDGDDHSSLLYNS